MDYMPPICPDCHEHDDGTRTCDPTLTLCPLNASGPNTAHVLPVGDPIEHGTDDCPCGPRAEPVTREDGSVGWVIVHHALDGRERNE